MPTPFGMQNHDARKASLEQPRTQPILKKYSNSLERQEEPRIKTIGTNANVSNSAIREEQNQTALLRIQPREKSELYIHHNRDDLRYSSASGISD